MKQYILVDMALLDNEDKGLNSNDKLAYALLYNRMISSVKHGELFFDKKRKEFYVIYPLVEMAKKLKVTERTIGKVYKRLEEQGMLQRQKQKYSADKLFLPLFDMEDARRNISKDVLDAPQQVPDAPANPVHEESSSQYTKKMHPNYVDSNYKNTINTVNTENGKKAEIKKLRTAVIGKSRMHPNAVDAVLRYVNYDRDEAEAVIGIIYSAKNTVAKAGGLLHAKITRFEHNDHMNIGLFSRLNHIFKYAVNTRKANGYIYNSLVNYFMHEFGLVRDEKVTPEMNNTTQGNNAVNSSASNDEPRKDKPVSLVKKIVIEEELRRFYGSGMPNEEKKQEIENRVKELLTEYGIDPKTTEPLPKDSSILKTINAEIAAV